MDNQAVIIDNDTNYTKMGYGGNLVNNDKYDYLIWEQAINQAKISNKHKLTYPMRDDIHYS